ncbi:hypothetical protein [Natrinema sp. SYSU A 869]|uniref:hypothetical protein n=1 Tax=Natrinema sp. SYSU A 869 TaxID=2871694 RepID=UPI001CA419F3|nr:hypothetical protein [Natrinema sp. SYSU A 869]
MVGDSRPQSSSTNSSSHHLDDVIKAVTHRKLVDIRPDSDDFDVEEYKPIQTARDVILEDC